MSLAHSNLDRSFVARAIFIALVLFGVTIYIFHHLYYVQFDPKLSKKLVSERDKICWVVQTEMAPRGRILDARNKVLATDLAYTDIYAWRPKFLRADQTTSELYPSLAADWAQVFDVDQETMLERLKRRSNQVTVKRYQEPWLTDEIERVSDLPRSKREELTETSIPGYTDLNFKEFLFRLDFEKSYLRHFPNPKFMSHVIGFKVEQDAKRFPGKYTGAGVEWTYDRYLNARRKGMARYLKTATGDKMYFEGNNYRKPESGHDVHLTLHEPLQAYAEQQVEAMVKKFKCKSGFAILANPKTGAILAATQYPDFTLNDMYGVEDDTLLNKMLMQPYEPGSTMKAIAIAGAMDAGVVSLHTKIDCEGGRWYYGGFPLKDSHRSHIISVRDIVKESSNIGTAKIGLMMGPRRLYTLFRKFGFGDITSCGLGQEVQGLLRPLGRWDKLSPTRFPMGQGIGTTPMQMVQAFCAIANYGEMMQLHAVDRIYDPNKDKMMVIQPTVKRRVLKPGSAARMINALTAVVAEQGGTGRRFRIDGVEVAGKTGTAEKFDLELRRYSNSKYYASFIGFAPATDAKFVLLVAGDEPEKSIGYYGGTVTGEAWKNIAEFALSYLQTSGLQ